MTSTIQKTLVSDNSTKDLALLASEFNSHHNSYIQTAQTCAAHAVKAGRILIEAKSQLAHGQWLPWLRENCECSERQAQRYMLIAKNWPELANPTRASDLSLRQALELISESTEGEEPAVEESDQASEPAGDFNPDLKTAETTNATEQEAQTTTDGGGAAEISSLPSSHDLMEESPDTESPEQTTAANPQPTITSSKPRQTKKNLEDFLTFDESTAEAKVFSELCDDVLETVQRKAVQLTTRDMRQNLVFENQVEVALLKRLATWIAAQIEN